MKKFKSVSGQLKAKLQYLKSYVSNVTTDLLFSIISSYLGAVNDILKNCISKSLYVDLIKKRNDKIILLEKQLAKKKEPYEGLNRKIKEQDEELQTLNEELRAQDEKLCNN